MISRTSCGSLAIGDGHGIDLSLTPPWVSRAILALPRYHSRIVNSSIAAPDKINNLSNEKWPVGSPVSEDVGVLTDEIVVESMEVTKEKST
jgi:hypothetical protein